MNPFPSRILLALLLASVFPHLADGQTGDDLFWQVVPGSELFSNAAVNAIAVSGDTVYFGGDFDRAGGVRASGIVMWIRSDDSWHRLGDASGRDGVNGMVRTLSVIDGDLYVGGDFDSAGGVAARNIALWDGSAWHPVGNGLPVLVSSIALHDGDPVAAGDNTPSSGMSDTYPFAWRLEGSLWVPMLGGGVPVAGVIQDLAVDRLGRLVVNAIGTFADSGARQFASFAWNAASARWEPLTAPEPVYRLHSMDRRADGRLVSIGSTSQSDGTMRLLILEDSVWAVSQGSTLPGDLLPATERFSDLITAQGDTLYVTGKYLHMPGAQPGNDVLRWDGSTWSGLGQGLAYEGNALAWSGGDLLVGGRFSRAGDTTAFSIARWAGGRWYPVGDGVSGGIVQMQSVHVGRGGALWVSGAFNRIGDVPANGIARWDGSAWSSPAEGIDTAATSLIETSGGELMVNGGYNFGTLTRAGGSIIPHVAEWSQGEWRSPGLIEAGLVRWFQPGAGFAEEADGTLWYGAGFMPNGSSGDDWIDPSLFVRRNGVWSIDSSVRGTFIRPVPCGTDLCAVGIFEHPGGGVNLEFNMWYGHWYGNIARFNGDSWSGLILSRAGSYDPIAYTILPDEPGLYVAGHFSHRSIPESYSIGRFDWMTGEWTPLGSGLRRAADTTLGMVRELVKIAGGLYAAGDFDTAGGRPASMIARWDGIEWSPLGSGLDAPVRQMASDSEGNLYVVGTFTRAGDKSVPGLAVWNNPSLSIPSEDDFRPEVSRIEIRRIDTRLVIDLPEMAREEGDIVISDLLGRTVLISGFSAGGGRLVVELPAGADRLAAGVYLVSVTGVAGSSVVPLP